MAAGSSRKQMKKNQLRNVLPTATISNGLYCAFMHPKIARNSNLPLARFRHPANLTNFLLSKNRSALSRPSSCVAMPIAISTVFFWCAPPQVTCTVIISASVDMAGFHFLGGNPAERFKNETMNVSVRGYAIMAESNVKIPERSCACLQNITSFCVAPVGISTNPPQIGDAVKPLIPNDRQPSFLFFGFDVRNVLLHDGAPFSIRCVGRRNHNFRRLFYFTRSRSCGKHVGGIITQIHGEKPSAANSHLRGA